MKLTPEQFAIDVVKRLQTAGFEALWAGGCVRDQLLGNTPKDYDVATNATPDQIRALFGHSKTLPLGAAFGVITVIGPRSAGNTEVATFRCDGQYSDGRRPDAVTFGTAEMDAQRRDFTINGLFFDPVSRSVIDYVDGQADLKKHLLRAIGDPSERIAEDKLRMLRAVRFAATLDFKVDPNTMSVISRCAPDINMVSAERIGAELTRMLLHANRRRAVELLLESKLMLQAPLFPEFESIAREPEAVERVLNRIAALENPELAECLVALLGEVVDSVCMVDVCRRLKLSNQIRDTADWVCKHQSQLQSAHERAWSKIQPLAIDERIENALRLMRADQVVTGRNYDSVAFLENKRRLPPEILNPPRLVDGVALQALGLSPGPLFSEILQTVRNMQLDGEIETVDAAIETVQRLFK